MSVEIHERTVSGMDMSRSEALLPIATVRDVMVRAALISAGSCVEVLEKTQASAATPRWLCREGKQPGAHADSDTRRSDSGYHVTRHDDRHDR